MSTALAELEVEREIARRFDECEGRFRTVVADDDYRLSAIMAVLGDPRGLVVLDLGCGKGRFARPLLDRGARVFGLDLSASMLAGGVGLPRLRASATRLPFADGSFDVVIAVEVFQHVQALRTAAAESFRVLRPEGRLIVVDKHAFALNVHRPWLPNLLVKAIDEHRGRGMYGAGMRAREHWRSSSAMTRAFREAGFVSPESRGLLAPAERESAVFRRHEWARAMRLWTGTRPRRTT